MKITSINVGRSKAEILDTVEKNAREAAAQG